MATARPITSARQVHARLSTTRRARQEHFIVFCLNARGCAISRVVVSIGVLNASLVHPREVFYPAILHNAASVIMAHNHPSGDPTPSDDDMAVTSRFVEAGRLLGIPVFDHVIVAEGGYTSLREEGLIT
jgi:DNA repair protein RadC